ncbi:MULTISPECIES: hypothetical protein [Nocardia]|uniref:hypothetical protein n=1 Tax=Nocardia TaxID=1817 RepID=UPI001E64689E|nr:hypothetical protein [Nocardia asteroides]UGT62321.1 hypothetical protein LTT61_02950 [Nocardia asteroides]
MTQSEDPVVPEDRLPGLFAAPLPAGVAALPAAHRADLAELVDAACARRIEELTSAAEDALDAIPAFLRPAIRRAVGR